MPQRIDTLEAIGSCNQILEEISKYYRQAGIIDYIPVYFHVTEYGKLNVTISLCYLKETDNVIYVVTHLNRQERHIKINHERLLYIVRTLSKKIKELYADSEEHNIVYK